MRTPPKTTESSGRDHFSLGQIKQTATVTVGMIEDPMKQPKPTETGQTTHRNKASRRNKHASHMIVTCNMLARSAPPHNMSGACVQYKGNHAALASDSELKFIVHLLLPRIRK